MSNANVKRALTESRQFRLSEYISGGYKLFQKNPVFYLAFMGIVMAFSFIGGTILGLIPYIGQFLSGILSAILMSGGYIYTHKLNTNQKADFPDFFAGFQQFQPIVIVYIIAQLASLVMFIPAIAYTVNKLGGFSAIMNQATLTKSIEIIVKTGDFSFFFIILALCIPAIIVSLLLSLAPLFVVLAGMEPIAALQASLKLTLRNVGYLLLFTIIWIFIMMISLIPCGLGLLITIPTYMCSIYLFFADHTDIEKDSGNQELLNHFVV